MSQHYETTKTVILKDGFYNAETDKRFTTITLRAPTVGDEIQRDLSVKRMLLGDDPAERELAMSDTYREMMLVAACIMSWTTAEGVPLLPPQRPELIQTLHRFEAEQVWATFNALDRGIPKSDSVDAGESNAQDDGQAAEAEGKSLPPSDGSSPSVG